MTPGDQLVAPGQIEPIIAPGQIEPIIAPKENLDERKTSVSRESMHKEIDKIFQKVEGYEIKPFSYSKKIIYISIVGWIIAFLLYCVIWDTTDSFFPSVHKNVFDFLLGDIVLSIPIILYSFSFITYLSILYDSRLADIAKVLIAKKTIRDLFVKIHNSEFSEKIPTKNSFLGHGCIKYSLYLILHYLQIQYHQVIVPFT